MTKINICIIIISVAVNGGVFVVIDLRPLLRGEKKELDVSFALDIDPIKSVFFDSNAKITGKVTDNAGYMRLKLYAELPYKSQCSRCLEDVAATLSINFERTVVAQGTLSDEQLDENIDEYVVVKNGFLDIDEELREAVILEFPTKILCSDDCPGLCPKCGKPLKDGDCGCPKKEIDPRLAVLANYFNKDEKK